MSLIGYFFFLKCRISFLLRLHLLRLADFTLPKLPMKEKSVIILHTWVVSLLCERNITENPLRIVQHKLVSLHSNSLASYVEHDKQHLGTRASGKCCISARYLSFEYHIKSIYKSARNLKPNHISQGLVGFLILLSMHVDRTD